jgi:histidyl-tRNA synthetase
MTRFDRLPGTRDFYPDEMRVRRWIEDRWREVALSYGFEEYDAPVIEPLGLFTDKSGEEIVEQIYSFVDRGDGRRQKPGVVQTDQVVFDPATVSL